MVIGLGIKFLTAGEVGWLVRDADELEEAVGVGAEAVGAVEGK